MSTSDPSPEHDGAAAHDHDRWKHDGVRVIPGNQLDPNTAQTPGMDRKAARRRAVAELLERLEPDGEPDTGGLFLDWDGARELLRRGFSVGVGTFSAWTGLSGFMPTMVARRDEEFPGREQREAGTEPGAASR